MIPETATGLAHRERRSSEICPFKKRHVGSCLGFPGSVIREKVRIRVTVEMRWKDSVESDTSRLHKQPARPCLKPCGLCHFNQSVSLCVKWGRKYAKGVQTTGFSGNMGGSHPKEELRIPLSWLR